MWLGSQTAAMLATTPFSGANAAGHQPQVSISDNFVPSFGYGKLWSGKVGAVEAAIIEQGSQKGVSTLAIFVWHPCQIVPGVGFGGSSPWKRKAKRRNRNHFVAPILTHVRRRIAPGRWPRRLGWRWFAVRAVEAGFTACRECTGSWK